MRAAEEEGSKELLDQFQRILDHNPLIDEVGFLHPTQLQSLEGDQTIIAGPDAVEFDHRYFWCRDHKLAVSSEILTKLYRAALHSHAKARSCPDAPSAAAALMRHSKSLLILCPDFLSAWNSRKMVLSGNYDLPKFMDELRLCTLVLSYSPKSENTWAHRGWVIKKVSENHEDTAELIEKESELVKEIAEKSKMNYRAWRHRCWLIPHMTRKQSLLLALLDDRIGTENGESSCNRMAETRVLWKEELRWNELLIRRYQGREALWIHRRFLAQCWIQHFLNDGENSPSTVNSGPTTSLLDLFLAQELYLLSDCLKTPADLFDDTRVQAQLAVLYILWISKRAPIVESKLEERLHSTGSLKDILARTCPEKIMLWTCLLGRSSG